MADEKARLFVAVEIPANIRDRIEAAVEPVRRRLPAGRWVSPNAFHVTLAFIGWVDDEEAMRVQDACGEAASASGAFRLALSGQAGTFGTGVLWAGLEDSTELDGLVAALRSALAGRGLAVDERPFHAHVTLARAGRGARIRQDLAVAYEGPTSSWPVERLVLMRSRLGPSGAQYSVEGAWPLGG